MDALFAVVELVARTLTETSFLVWVLLVTLWSPPLVAAHELGHAAAATRLTRAPVTVRLHGRWFWPSLAGSCEYDAERLWKGRHEAWIALAGPAASAGACAVLLALAFAAGEHRSTLEAMFTVGALVAAGHALASAVPLRYSLGSGAAGLDSDGRAAWRILTGGVGHQPVLTYGRDSSEQPAVRPLFAIVLAAAAALAFVVDVLLGLALIALFGIAWLVQRADENAGR